MRLTRTLGMAGALILAALVGGTLIGATMATDDPTDTDSTTEVDGYCDTFMDALATELGVSRDELVSAGRTAANAAVDAAVANGDLSDERAATLRERIADADADGCAWFGHAPGFVRGFAHGFGHGLDRGEIRGFLGGEIFEAAAEALGIDSSELMGQLAEAGSLEALAEAQGVSYDDVTSAVVAAMQADLDAAVEDGLDQDAADQMLERLSTWLDEGGEVDDAPGFGLRHFEGGPFGPFAPWNDDDSDDTDSEDAGA